MKGETEKINDSIKNLKKENNNIYNRNTQRFINLERRSVFIESMLDELFEKLEIEKKICPICGCEQNVFLAFGGEFYKNSECVECTSLERHRFLYLYLKKKDFFKNKIKLLHFAPETVFYKVFTNLKNVDYWPVDIDENPIDLDDKFKIRETMDMQEIPHENESFDIIYNSHVLEHVPDDIKALKELYRVVKKKEEGGKVIIMVPIDETLEKTLEDPKHNTSELRIKFYGQADHVRKYGLDFPEKLKQVGFKVEVITPEEVTEKKNFKKYGLLEQETIYICSK